MEKVFFTFGSDPKYPYQRNDYVIVLGTDRYDCLDTYKKKYPNRPGSNAVNCADYYIGQEWEHVYENYYKNTEPKEILISNTVYGQKPEGFDPVWFFVPSKHTLVFLQEGTGGDRKSKDIKDGYVYYLGCTSYNLGQDEIKENAGGMFMIKKYVQNKYTCLTDAIPDVLNYLYHDSYLNAQILQSMK